MQSSGPQDRYVPSWFVFLFAVATVVRGGLSGYVWDSIVPYQVPGGNPALKIHPGAYLILALTAWMMLTRRDLGPLLRDSRGKAALALSGGIGLMLGLYIWRGQMSSLSYLIDSILVAPAAILCTLAMSDRQRGTIAAAVIYLALANSLFSIVQVAVRSQILPGPEFPVSDGFRASGVLGHPLLTGAVHVSAIPLLYLTNWSMQTKLLATVALLVGVFAGQARIATIAAAGILPIIGWIEIRRALRAGVLRPVSLFVGATCALSAIPIMVLGLLASGALDRILNGMFDESGKARVEGYRIFNYISQEEWLFGTDLNQAVQILRSVIGLPAIESPIVVYILQFGLIGALIFSAAMLLFFLLMARALPPYGKLAVLTFLLIASTNNQLAAKGPSMFLVAVLLGGVSRPPHAASRLGWRRLHAGRNDGSGPGGWTERGRPKGEWPARLPFVR